MPIPLYKAATRPSTTFGMNLEFLADLPQDLRRRIIDALTEADEAMKSGDDGRITEVTRLVTDLHRQVQEFRADQAARKAFAAPPAARGHDAIRYFAKRAGMSG